VHITVEMDAYAPSTGISTDERARLIAALKARLTGIEPFTVLCGSPIANRTGAILDTQPTATAVRGAHRPHTACKLPPTCTSGTSPCLLAVLGDFIVDGFG